METSGQLQAPAASPPGKGLLLHIRFLGLLATTEFRLFCLPLSYLKT